MNTDDRMEQAELKLDSWLQELDITSEDDISSAMAMTNAGNWDWDYEDIEIEEVDSITSNFSCSVTLQGGPRKPDVPFIGEYVSGTISGTMVFDEESEDWKIEDYDIDARVCYLGEKEHTASIEPRITSITIENFKGISKPVTIPLKPITLLFGKNSAGKSTVLQAMLYAQEVIRTGRADIDKIQLGGDSINLGGFRNLVHKHDVTRTIRLRFDIQLDEWGLEAYPIHFEYGLYDDLESDALGSLKSIYIELEISSFQNNPEISRYFVGIGQTPVVSIGKTSKDAYFANIENYFEQAFYNEHDELIEDIQEAYQLLNEPPNQAPVLGNVQLIAQTSCVPIINRPLQFEENRKAIFDEISPEENHTMKSLDVFLSRFLVRPIEILYKHLNSIRYIGPIREIPQRNHQAPISPDESRWANGLAAWDALYQAKEAPLPKEPYMQGSVIPRLNKRDAKLIAKSAQFTLQKVNEYLRDVLQLGYEIRREDSVAINANHDIFDLLDNLDEEQVSLFLHYYTRFRKYMLSRPSTQRLFLYDLDKEVEVTPSDIGAGISQVLPVIVGVLAESASGKLPGILSIEQPELHIHPAVQCALGDLFIKEKSENRIFLIETHSEHLILRLLRRIGETTDNELPDISLSLTPDELSVIYANTPKDGNLELTELPVDDDGEFTTHWPEGFFEERAEELF